MVTKEALIEVRKATGESQKVFALRFGVDQVTIHRWETNGIPETGTTRVLIERVLADLASVPRPAAQPVEAAE